MFQNEGNSIFLDLDPYKKILWITPTLFYFFFFKEPSIIQ